MALHVELGTRMLTLTLTVWLHVVGKVMCHKQFLYYATEARENGSPAGLWGGWVDPQLNIPPKDMDMRLSGFHCADMKKDYYTSLRIQGMNYDPHTNSTILDLDERSDAMVSALKVPVCKKTPSCSPNGHSEVLFSRAENDDRPQPFKVGPFAMYNSTVYFVAQRFLDGDKPKSRTHLMEIRRLGGCEENYPFTSTKQLDLDLCSEFVALIVEETKDDIILQMRETLQPADHLHIIKKGRKLAFLVQIYNSSFDEEEMLTEYSMNLMLVEEYSPRPAMRLHKETVPLDFTWHFLRSLGAISYRDGVLCWTSMDRIVCAKWDLKSAPTHVTTVLKSGQAAKVCRGTKETPLFANVTTGVAIAETDNGLSLYFGCYAQDTKAGGAGLLKMSSNWQSQSSLSPLIDKHGKVHAGSMFFTNACAKFMPKKNEKTPLPIEESTPVAEKATSGAKMYLMTVSTILFSSFIGAMLC